MYSLRRRKGKGQREPRLGASGPRSGAPLAHVAGVSVLIVDSCLGLGELGKLGTRRGRTRRWVRVRGVF